MTKQKDVLLPEVSLAWPDFIKELMHNSYHFFSGNKDVFKLLAWQRLDGGNAGHELGKPSESAKCWIEAFAHYQQQGVIKKGCQSISFGAYDVHLML